MSVTNDTERTLLEAVLKLPPERRAACLDAACGEDGQMRRRLGDLVEAQAKNEDLDKAPIAASSKPTMMISLPASEQPGDRIGRYKLLQEIGEGGCGVVYMAEQEEPVRRRVALKVIKLGMDTKSVIARFEAERQALAMMDHPNIAKVLDAGATEAGRPFFVMELVRGVKITEYCDQNRLATRERLDLFIQVCHAIQHAHQKGIIHRDIKPSNILVTLHDGKPVPKVIDFGIAKATDQRLTDKTLFTQFESFIGTPAYMSPEQAEMSGLDIDTRSDIYSLGVLLYELLTSRTPFDPKELQSAGLEGMRRKIREQEPVRPSTRLGTMEDADRAAVAKQRQIESLRLVNLLRGDLDWIVLKALEKDRTRRYETANGMAMDVQRHLQHEPIVARPPSGIYRFQKMVQRNKLAVSAAGAVVAALIMGLAFSTWQYLGKSKAYQRAVAAELEQSHLREAAQRAEAEEARLRRLAEAQERVARSYAYASDMNLVQQALAANNLGRAQDLLRRHRPQPGQSDLRGWEWRYLWQQCQSDALFTLTQKSNSILSLAVSPDGRQVAVGEAEKGGLSIWNLLSRKQEVKLDAGEGMVRVAFSPYEHWLAYSYDIGRGSSHPKYGVRLWDISAQKSVSDFELKGLCLGLGFSDDGTKLIASAASKKEQIALWQMPEEKKLAAFEAPQIESVLGNPFAMARDASFAIHRNSGDSIRAIELTSGKELWKVKGAEESVTSLALSPDGKTLASGAGILESEIRLWVASTGRELKRLEGHRSYILGLAFSPDGKTLASASADQTIRLWDMTDNSPSPRSRVLRGHKLEVWSLALVPGTTRLVSGSKDGDVLCWDTTSMVREGAHTTLPEQVAVWCFTPDSKSVITVSRQSSVAMWSGDGFQVKRALLELPSHFMQWSFSRDAKFLAQGSATGTVSVWDLQRRIQIREVQVSNQPVAPIGFIANDTKMFAACADNSLHELDLVTGNEIRSWKSLPNMNTAAVSEDEKWGMLLGGGDESFLWDLTSGNVTQLSLGVRQASGAAFSPDGKTFAAASKLGSIQLWEFGSWKPLDTMRGFLLGIHSLVYSPDGRRIAAGSSGREALKLWDAESRQELITLEGQGTVFQHTHFSPDGNTLASLNADGILNLWRAPSWDDIKTKED